MITWIEPSELQRAALTFAKQEIGTREIGTTNTGKRVEEYLLSVGLGPGYPWCAAFVSWCIQQTEKWSKQSSGIIRSAYTPDYLRCRGSVVCKGNPVFLAPGMLFLKWFDKLHDRDGNVGRVGHIGFIEGPADRYGYVLTIEGNSNDDGSREGYEVCQRSRPLSDIYATVSYP